MAKITRIQIANINEKCGNGFSLDVSHYIVTGEIHFVKHIDICKNTRYEYRLMYKDKFRVIKSKGKVKKVVTTNRYIAVIQVSKLTCGESLDVWINHGVEFEISSNDLTVDSKSLKYLQKLTHKLDDDTLISFMNNS